MELFKNKDDCCGCNTCEIVCPMKAITMQADKEGFLYPNIDNDKCINCGLCKKNCSFQSINSINKTNEFPIIYAVKNKDNDIRKRSTSGGVFTNLSEYIISNHGIVYGAVLNKDLKVIHEKAETMDGIERMRGSKYVQSELKNVFVQIKDEIKTRKVLFTGTPCQISALKLYLRNQNLDNLYLCDIVCHGVPSPKLWFEHISFIEKHFKKRISNYQFRSKINGWGNHTEVVYFTDGTYVYKSSIVQSFKYLFYTNAALRPSCYKCKYANLNRESDITIADFWGIEKNAPDFIDSLGVSLTMINTKKGLSLFESISSDIISINCDLQKSLQPNMINPTKERIDRNVFWNIYYNKGYKNLLKKYSSYGLYYHTRQIIKKILGMK
ncbi:MAG: Coenzyme F420 hydrogenase/dehydrogenase, beta subunit C-terminal domain [Erysipelotrichales bacterium]|nr:Coenzyme F420 hydrogenase/dehydrogenase, beta subunit C-terminal domain [Erysipelotrichales bacterium]